MKKAIFILLLLIIIASIGYQLNFLTEDNSKTTAPPSDEYEVCDENSKRYASEKEALESGLSYAEFGATFCPEYKMHPSWDSDGDGINDCEKEGICDTLMDYSQPRQK